MLMLHGVWLPDGLFLFAMEEHRQIPVTHWRSSLQNTLPPAVAGHLRAESRKFHMPERTLKGGFRGSRQEKLPLLTLGGLLAPVDVTLALLVALAPTDHFSFTCADDYVYWQHAGRFARQLVQQGRIMPALQMIAPDDERFGRAVAVWTADLRVAEDQTWVSRMATQMPAVCRAYHPGKDPGWLQTTPYDIVQSFLTAVVDASVRRAITAEHTKQWHRLSAEGSHNAGELGERFMSAMLVDPEPTVLRASLSSLHILQTAVTEWTTTGQVSTIPPQDNRNSLDLVHLCLRLQTPADETAEWIVQLSLQTAHDPSLEITAQDVWSLGQADWVTPTIRFPGMQETLLAALGQAAKHFTALTRAVPAERPVMVYLSTEEAYEFLTVHAQTLREHGVAVQVPGWWTQPVKPKVGLRMKVKYAATESNHRDAQSALGLQQLLSYDAELALGDDPLTASELAWLAAQKQHLVTLRGAWVEIDPDAMASVLRNWHSLQQGELTVAEAMRMTAGETMPAGLHSLPVKEFVAPPGLLPLLRGGTATESTPVEPPQALLATLRPYQHRGYEWLCRMSALGFGVCLADDMGLGKTVQVIAFLLQTRAQQFDGAPALVVCPTSLLGNWNRELTRFAPSLTVRVHHGPNRPTGATWRESLAHSDVILTTYNLITRDQPDFAATFFSHVILDEAGAIKNPDSKQARAVFTLQTPARIAMTGTPIENRLSELWSLFHFLNPGYLHTQTEFRAQFALPIERAHDRERADLLQRLIAPFVMRRVKTDPAVISDLPSKLEMKTLCPLSREQASLYEATVNDLLSSIEDAEGMQRRGLVLSSLTKLKQICDHPALFLQDGNDWAPRSGKLVRLTEIVEETQELGESVLIFTQYRAMGEMLVRHLSKITGDQGGRPLFLHGGVSKTRRDEMVEAFQSRNGPRVFILSVKAGGVGLNLTRANHVIHYDRWWNPAVENQATDRAFRIGQTKNVEVHKFICAGTLEDHIDQLIESKRELSELVVAGGETWLTEMSTQDLRTLFTLRDEAVFSEEELA